MPLDPFLAAKLPLLEGLASAANDDAAAARWAEFERDPAPWSMPHGVSVGDGAIQGPHGATACRVYRPARATSVVLVWVHGGGFAAGDLDMPESHVVGAELASRAGATVVSVDYRLAGEGTRYPIPLDDVYDAWLGVLSGSTAGVDGRVFLLGGASAGGALALSAAIRLRDLGGPVPAALLLAYPFAHFPNPAAEPQLSVALASLPESLRFTPISIEAMVRAYVGRISDVPREAMPGSARLDGLPPVHLLISEYDDLRPSAELLSRQLADLGNGVTSYLARGMLHGHLNRTPSLPEVDRSLQVFAEVLRAHAGPRVGDTT